MTGFASDLRSFEPQLTDLCFRRLIRRRAEVFEQSDEPLVRFAVREEGDSRETESCSTKVENRFTSSERRRSRIESILQSLNELSRGR